MARGLPERYPDEVKAQVMAALLAGQSVSAVAQEYNIPKGTVSNWKRKAHQAMAGESLGRKSLDELLFAYVAENLATLREQVRVFRDRDWLRGQSASEVAVLHGVLADKTIRLLEAFGEPPE
ncbi:helix-turn-helix domain-containing protein [Caldilinea sp.]|uniref:helix-turn-helix domain-containing protein n=1 Tax=Caldilinea sp. TaxID=2293560 RepID=UPI0021DCBAF0|nr:helix-turn-helix domain-containing protein [Caldilinea sp.]GIV73552.1 MAG: hypothetical protein KatS3mg049_2108 [Caldilinea sp.]